MTLLQALVAEAVPPRQHCRCQGYPSLMCGMAVTFGPVSGGWLTQAPGWPDNRGALPARRHP
jgi:MFS family permease